jgi:hypothetical protein
MDSYKTYVVLDQKKFTIKTQNCLCTICCKCYFKSLLKGWAPVARACNPSFLRGRDQEDCSLKGQIVHETLSQKHPTQRTAGRVTQVEEYLPRRCEALSSNTSTTQNKKIP